jgi:peptidoglycan-associated lipoprotein
MRSDQRPAAEAKAPILAGNPSLKIRVEGNADERGSAEYNIALGMRRAAEAKRFLTERGVDRSRIETVSFGKERPVCTAHEESCWQQNRRDDFRITAGDVSAYTPISNR